jgi:agmatinase
MEAADLLRPAGTFFGVPRGTASTGSRVVSFGIPFDMGAHPSRIGGRGGPSHVRAHSLLVAEHLQDFDIDLVAALGLVDLGDVDVTPGEVGSAFPKIERVTANIAEVGAIPLSVGGDGAVTLPQLRALRRVHGPLALLHFDAHTDAYLNQTSGQPFNNGNSFVHAAEEGLVDLAAAVHVGVRDTSYRGLDGPVGVARDLGYQVLTMSNVVSLGIADVVRQLHAVVGSRPTYLCWDMDVFDPSVSPGVVTPAWGGLTVREGLQLLEGLRGINFVGFDINTVSPPHDRQGQTGALAAHVMRECLFLAAETPRMSETLGQGG